MTSPVMPCSVVVFTIGLLLLFARKVNMFLVLFLCHWSLIGLSKTYFFRIPEDSAGERHHSRTLSLFQGILSEQSACRYQAKGEIHQLAAAFRLCGRGCLAYRHSFPGIDNKELMVRNSFSAE